MTGRPDLILLGDPQRTSRIEAWRERNDAERARIVAGVAAARPGLLVLLGDLVFRGSSRRHWARYDALIAPIRDAGIPMLAVPGNHEYRGRRRPEGFLARFPPVEGRTWFTRRFGPAGLVFLDSNDRKLGPARWREQLDWLSARLAEWNGDSGVRGVLVFLHHPAFTNSRVTGDAAPVAGDVRDVLAGSRQVVLVAAGHVHTYERFLRDGVTYVNSGGGGGPRVRLLTGADRRHPDDLYPGPAPRDFHWVELSIGAAGVDAKVIGLPKGGTRFHEMDAFRVEWRE